MVRKIENFDDDPHTDLFIILEDDDELTTHIIWEIWLFF